MGQKAAFPCSTAPHEPQEKLKRNTSAHAPWSCPPKSCNHCWKVLCQLERWKYILCIWIRACWWQEGWVLLFVLSCLSCLLFFLGYIYHFVFVLKKHFRNGLLQIPPVCGWVFYLFILGAGQVGLWSSGVIWLPFGGRLYLNIPSFLIPLRSVEVLHYLFIMTIKRGSSTKEGK